MWKNLKNKLVVFYQSIKQWYFNLWIARDQFMNAFTGGKPDETISSRLWKYHRDSWMRKFVDFIFGKNHCENSAEWDE